LARSIARSFLFLQSIVATGGDNLYFEIGCGAATATISGGAVTSVSVTNAGFGYTHPPLVRFWGGGNNYGNTSWVGVGQPNMPPPNSVGSATSSGEPYGAPAAAHAVLSGGTISSIVVDNGGAGYTAAPYVEIINSDIDFVGCAVPSTSSGILLAPGGTLTFNGTCCPTDPIAVYGATTNDSFVCRWMD
jgi:hypothetical protein